MYKIHNNILPSYFLNLFTTNLSIRDHFTMQASKLHLTLQLSERRVFRFTVLNFETVSPKTLQIQNHLSQYLQKRCIKFMHKTT